MEKNIEPKINLDIEEMAKAGLHFGHHTSRVHPKMIPYIFGIRNEVCIIDLEKAREKFLEALDFFKEIVKENKLLLVVATKPPINEIVEKFAKSLNFPYLTERWVGGLFTNFDVVKERWDYLKELEEKMKDPQFLESRTKKEKKKIEKEIEKLRKKFGGIRTLERLPDVVFVVDPNKDKLAVDEAKRKNIKIIGVCDTDCDPSKIDYPIIGNNDSISSVEYILNKIREVILSVKNP